MRWFSYNLKYLYQYNNRCSYHIHISLCLPSIGHGSWFRQTKQLKTTDMRIIDIVSVSKHFRLFPRVIMMPWTEWLNEAYIILGPLCSVILIFIYLSLFSILIFFLFFSGSSTMMAPSVDQCDLAAAGTNNTATFTVSPPDDVTLSSGAESNGKENRSVTYYV